MANSKKKGSQWERNISKYLTYWLTNQKDEYYFWRSPSSGAIGTISNKNEELFGDIISIKEESKFLTDLFVIEAKNGYPGVSLDNFFKKNKSDQFKKFWIQVVNNSSESNKYPLLIYKKKGFKTPWVCITPEIYNQLRKYLENEVYIFIKWYDNLPNMIILNMDDFFNNIIPEYIKKLK